MGAGEGSGQERQEENVIREYLVDEDTRVRATISGHEGGLWTVIADAELGVEPGTFLSHEKAKESLCSANLSGLRWVREVNGKLEGAAPR